MAKIAHHPDELVLFDFYNGRLSPGQALVISAHLEVCDTCRSSFALYDHIGAMLLDEVMPQSMREDALDLALARIDRPAPERVGPKSGSGSKAPLSSSDIAPYLEGIDLPQSLKEAKFKKRYWGAPGVWLAQLDTQSNDGSKTYLMHVAKGIKMPEHDHQGMEMTLVLNGEFSDHNGTYKPGDLIICEAGHHHSPAIAMEQDCLCLISALAPIAPKTILGKLLQPFARI
jgi:putative transcriptional regulator